MEVIGYSAARNTPYDDEVYILWVKQTTSRTKQRRLFLHNLVVLYHTQLTQAVCLNFLDLSLKVDLNKLLNH